MNSSVSVVMATLGEQDLSLVINSLLSNSVTPFEILICIPNEYYYRVKRYETSNIRVVKTEKCGQVYQRCIGLSAAKGHYIMQIDDDVILDRFCIESLINGIRLMGVKTAVSPALYYKNTDYSVYKLNSSILKTMYYWIINGRNGYSQGSVTKAGVSFGVDPSISSGNYVLSEWLPGGCVMHTKDNLILKNFFPFPGKAFSEDLIHSWLLRKKGIKLFVCTKGLGYIDIEDSLYAEKFFVFIKLVFLDFRARKYYVKISRRSKLRMYMYYMIEILLYFVRRIMKLFSNNK
jgi:glycosyltransferase involved in cell wall biosynthesis